MSQESWYGCLFLQKVSFNGPEYSFLLQVPGDQTQHSVLKSQEQLILFQPKKFVDDALAGLPFFRKGFSLDIPLECPWDQVHQNLTCKLLNSTEAVRHPHETGHRCSKEIKVILLPCSGLFCLLCLIEHTQHALLKRITDFFLQVIFGKKRKNLFRKRKNV